MQCTVFGQTDKRAVIYSMLNICQRLGDCIYITNDRKAFRLMQDGAATLGELGNITIAVTDTTGDEMWHDLGIAPNDFEYIFLDNIYNDDTNCIIYVEGAGKEEADAYLFDMFDAGEMTIVKMGSPRRGKGEKPSKKEKGEDVQKSKVYNIPYDKAILQNIEECEFYGQLRPISAGATQVACQILAPYAKMSAKDLGKVALKK